VKIGVYNGAVSTRDQPMLSAIVSKNLSIPRPWLTINTPSKQTVFLASAKLAVRQLPQSSHINSNLFPPTPRYFHSPSPSSLPLNSLLTSPFTLIAMSSGANDNTSATALNSSHTSPFRFLNLPGEIRNHIYRYCLVECEDRQHEDQTEDFGFLASADSPSDNGILRVCKQMQNEALPIFITMNTWKTIKLKVFSETILDKLNFNRVPGLRKLHLKAEFTVFGHLQISKEDNCYLHIQLARLFYVYQLALRNLRELKIFTRIDIEEAVRHSDMDGKEIANVE
jgi:hypothetical protein